MNAIVRSLDEARSRRRPDTVRLTEEQLDDIVRASPADPCTSCGGPLGEDCYWHPDTGFVCGPCGEHIKWADG